ncbi:DUF421 domain-containing protein [Halalkalibacter alkaliphilus]|uniref:DUF421 domain-containing protein n=1 Tax=Halalkalibacter alkaliphilus TaxID=2917993 RepID=A0A9X2CR99_9BACI|nr:DUF421 domain-containing protein [Halalkalibacter alkaliphilus]MCL7745574.1 DUF421 domain-containing protein [Halalkalibacter alkaliphilus]
MLQTLEIIFRCFLAFVMLISIAHLLGKQTISQMTYHDFIATLMLGAIAGNLTFNLAISIKYIIVALLTFVGILFLSTLLSLKNRNIRALLSGEPTVIIQDGLILEGNLKKLKFTMDSLNQALREKDIFDIDEVEYAIMETDGHISVLKKLPHRSTTKKDIGIFSHNKSFFPIELVMDGQIVEKNFTQNQLTKSWLDAELSQRGLKLEDVSYCVRGTNNQLYFDLYKDNIHSPVDLES